MTCSSLLTKRSVKDYILIVYVTLIVTEEDGETEDSELVDLVEADNVSQAGDNTVST